MNERDLAYPEISTTVRLEDVKNIFNELNLKSIGLGLNFTSLFSKTEAATKALKMFSKNRTKRFTPRGPFGEIEPDVMTFGKRDIFVYRFGNPRGKKVLLCHGWGGQASDFYRMIHPFIDLGFEVITFDGPAHGQSSGTHTNMFEFVEVIEYLATQETEIEIAIGHSMGGMALALANHLSLKFNPKKLVAMGAPNKLETVFEEYANYLGLSEKVLQRMQLQVEKITQLKFKDVKLENLMNSHQELETMLVHDYLDKIVPFKRAQEVQDRAHLKRFYSSYGLGHVKILRDKDVIEEVCEFIA